MKTPKALPILLAPDAGPVVREENVAAYFMSSMRGRVWPRYRHTVKKINASAAGWRSWPDTVVFFESDDGLPPVHFLELKRPKGFEFKARQRRTQVGLRGMGYFVDVLYRRADVDAYVALVLEHGPHGMRLCK